MLLFHVLQNILSLGCDSADLIRPKGVQGAPESDFFKPCLGMFVSIQDTHISYH